MAPGPALAPRTPSVRNAKPETWNTKAILAFLLSFLMTIPGIVLGHIALNEIGNRPQRGRGLAVAALVISYLSLAGTVIVFLMALARLHDP